MSTLNSRSGTGGEKRSAGTSKDRGFTATVSAYDPQVHVYTDSERCVKLRSKPRVWPGASSISRDREPFEIDTSRGGVQRLPAQLIT